MQAVTPLRNLERVAQFLVCPAPDLNLPDPFDNIADWLAQRALQDEVLTETIAQPAVCLINGRIPVNRTSTSRTMLHPVIGLVDFT
jgi:hypothetical protein